MTAEERFWKFVNKTDGCWLWEGGIKSNGYGQFKISGRMVGVHRFSYELHVGPIPIAHDIDHICRTRNCVRPDHLRSLTRHEHLMISGSPVALNAWKRECINGHPFDEENTRMRPQGGRDCRTCQREYKRKRRAKKKEATA